jgi:nitrite reductase (NADH) small subunit/3-phenylpropionate/trans-cinnamate dioxygenase ferredoxin subunit
MGKLADLPVGGVLEKRIRARRVAVFNVAGKLYGLEADCKHMGASLAAGMVKDGIVTCRWHHWRYVLDTGECLNLKGAYLKRYDVKVQGDDIYVQV